MNELAVLGNVIKTQRLSLNMRMDDVANKANITRSTLWAIEKGTGNCSIVSLLKVMRVLGLSLNIENSLAKDSKRNRATRVNTAFDKKINRFVIMCIEQYAKYINASSGEVYKIMSEKGIIDELTNDYEDLHGMSSVYINDYISSLL